MVLLRIAFFICFLSVAQVLPAAVKLPALLGNNMVLQQKSEVNLWGQANGESITITTSWDKKARRVQVNHGKWETKVTTPTAGGPYQITFDDGEKLTLNNILIGEVWICSGQSNMAMLMKGAAKQPILNSAALIASSKNPQIRLFTVGRATTLAPQTDCQGKWQEAEPASVQNLSAVAYQFGKILQEKLQVPIGLVVSAVGGTPIQAWMSPKALAAFPEIKLPQPGGDTAKLKVTAPTVLYNAMIAPLLPLKAKGFIWYQGENNRPDPALYARLFPAFVQDWRTRWENSELPFYYVQIAPLQVNRPELLGRELRDVQRKALNDIPNSGMASTMDAGDEKGIHPPDKTKPAQRLAALALAKTYGQKNITPSGPLYKNLQINGNKALVSFYYADKGLTATHDQLQLFEIAGADQVFYPATARIIKDKVEVQSDQVKAPVAIRYAYKEWVIGELFNKEGFPASSFRTDNWPINK